MSVCVRCVCCCVVVYVFNVCVYVCCCFVCGVVFTYAHTSVCVSLHWPVHVCAIYISSAIHITKKRTIK